MQVFELRVGVNVAEPMDWMDWSVEWAFSYRAFVARFFCEARAGRRLVVSPLRVSLCFCSVIPGFLLTWLCLIISVLYDIMTPISSKQLCGSRMTGDIDCRF